MRQKRVIKDICTDKTGIRKKLENHPEDRFNKIIIVNFCEKVPDNYQEKFKEQFALVSLDGEVEVSEASLEGNFKAKKKESAHFLTPADTKWSDIEIGVDYYNRKLCIKVKGKNTKIGFLEFGLKDGRSKKDKLTVILMKLLEYAGAENNVIYTGKMQPKEFEKLDTDTKRLNKLIRLSIKGIDDPPITYTKSEGFKSQFGRLYLIDTDYDGSREITTSEISDVPDPDLEDLL